MDVQGFDEFTLVGSGGNAHVYSTVSRISGQSVAVKVIRGGGDAAVQRRFDRERSIMEKLEQFPNVVPILESGFTRSGDPYLVMPLYTGGSLADTMAAGPTPWREAVAITRKLAKAVESAHAKQVLHLDIKPANVLLDEYGEPWVTDFGISEMLGSTASMSGKMMTPAYTPPERINGGKPSELTDVYGLGATLFALLAGKAPYSTADSSNPMAMMMSVVNDPIPVDQIDESLPENVRALLLRTMAKNPRHRPQSARELVGLLDDVAKGMAISGPESSLFATTGAIKPIIARPEPTREMPALSLSLAPTVTPAPAVLPRASKPAGSRMAAAAMAVMVMFAIGAFALFGEDNGAGADQQRVVVDPSEAATVADEAEVADDVGVDAVANADDAVQQVVADEAEQLEEAIGTDAEPITAEPETEVLGTTAEASNAVAEPAVATTQPAAEQAPAPVVTDEAGEQQPDPTVPETTTTTAPEEETPETTEAPVEAETADDSDEADEVDEVDSPPVTEPELPEEDDNDDTAADETVDEDTGETAPGNVDADDTDNADPAEEDPPPADEVDAGEADEEATEVEPVDESPLDIEDTGDDVDDVDEEPVDEAPTADEAAVTADDVPVDDVPAESEPANDQTAGADASATDSPEVEAS